MPKKKKLKKEKPKEIQEKKLSKEDNKIEKKESDKRKIVKITLIIATAIIVLVLSAYFYVDSLKSYTYMGVEFKTIQEGNLIFYQTSIPVIYQGSVVPYNFYLRTKPQKLKNVPFNVQDFELMKISVLNFEKDFNCEGDAVIAIANLMKLHDVLGINILRDQNATCDSRYNSFFLKESEETGINQIGENCYEININDCEILEVTERLMLEIFVKLKEE